MTLGEYRVGITFNPSSNPDVDKIKHAAADLIDILNDWSGDERLSEANELMQIAMRKIESAAMDAVKAVTKGPMQ